MSQSIDLSRVPDEDLADALRSRIPSSGFLSSGLFNLVVDVMPVVCVDGVAYRYAADGTPEVLAIRRDTGEARGKLCVVGGRVLGGKLLQRQSVADALRKHFRCDLGREIELDTDWQRPFAVGQAAPHGTGAFAREDAKHAVALRYLVRFADEEEFVFGEGFGGREAGSVEWLSRLTLPEPDAFGFDHHDIFVDALDILEARRNL